jgi:hypothetical protein
VTEHQELPNKSGLSLSQSKQWSMVKMTDPVATHNQMHVCCGHQNKKQAVEKKDDARSHDQFLD